MSMSEMIDSCFVYDLLQCFVFFLSVFIANISRCKDELQKRNLIIGFMRICDHLLSIQNITELDNKIQWNRKSLVFPTHIRNWILDCFCLFDQNWNVSINDFETANWPDAPICIFFLNSFAANRFKEVQSTGCHFLCLPRFVFSFDFVLSENTFKKVEWCFEQVSKAMPPSIYLRSNSKYFYNLHIY